MKVQLWCLFLLSSFYHASAQISGGSCSDDFVWCFSQRQYCNLGLIQRQCKDTCGVCNLTSSLGDSCGNLGCEYSCAVNPSNRNDMVCTCSSGFKLNEDGRTCSDIDECAATPSPCNDVEYPICENVAGAFGCVTCEGTTRGTTYYQSDSCCKKTGLNGCGQNSATGVSPPSGPDVLLGLWPWTVLIDVDERKCTGVLISHSWVLTNAHCFDASSVGAAISVQVGIRNTYRNDANEYSQQIRVDEVVVHENFDFPNNDIALIHLERNLSNSWAVRPVCMPGGEIPSQGQRCWVSGYETVFYQNEAVRALVESGVVLRNSSDCTGNLGQISSGADFDNMLCGQYDFSTTVSCPGETGGPLVCQKCDSCDWYVAGIAVFGDMCLVQDNSYAGYTSIETYEEWISTRTGIQINENRVCASRKVSWRPWNSWSACTQTCGTGTKRRSRICRYGSAGSLGCYGNRDEIQKCNTIICPRWGEYSSWSSCSVTCGQGTRTRSRFCLDGSIGQKGCHVGSNQQTTTCFDQSCPQWTSWSSWSSCDETCGEALESRRRACMNGEIRETGCRGSSTIFRSCNLPTCPRWSEWSKWSSCSPTCGQSRLRTANRQCLNGNVCEESGIKTESCESIMCPPEFTEWSECTASCGTGGQFRFQICLVDDSSCPSEVRNCNTQPCPTPTYTIWSTCSTTCGDGQQTRQKVCNAADLACTNEVEARTCSVQACSSWSEWSSFNQCDVTCGQGIATRTRTCRNERNCSGSSEETVRCYNPPCPAVRCPSLTSNRYNFSSNCSDSNSVGSICRLQCPSHQQIVGTNQTRCESSAEWIPSVDDTSCQNRTATCLGDQKSWCKYVIQSFCENSKYIRDRCQNQCDIC